MIVTVDDVLKAMAIYKEISRTPSLGIAFSAPHMLAVQAENDPKIGEKYPSYKLAIETGQTPIFASAVAISCFINDKDAEEHLDITGG